MLKCNYCLRPPELLPLEDPLLLERLPPEDALAGALYDREGELL